LLGDNSAQMDTCIVLLTFPDSRNRRGRELQIQSQLCSSIQGGSQWGRWTLVRRIDPRGKVQESQWLACCRSIRGGSNNSLQSQCLFHTRSDPCHRHPEWVCMCPVRTVFADIGSRGNSSPDRKDATRNRQYPPRHMKCPWDIDDTL